MDSYAVMLHNGYSAARRITKQHAKTFYFASFFLPRKKRYAAYALYALCRQSDDAADKSQPHAQIGNIHAMRELIAKAYSGDTTKHPLLLAFRDTVRTYTIPKAYFDELIEGMLMDAQQILRLADEGQLYRYCYKVAGVVGLMMLHIFGPVNPANKEHAIELGIAMQLTNIIRDVKEDYQRGRIYLPSEEMRCFDVTEEDIQRGYVTPQVKKLFDYQITRARDYYSRAQPGIAMLANKHTRTVTAIMSSLYAAILQAVIDNGYDVFSKRVYVGLGRKISLTLKLLYTRR